MTISEGQRKALVIIGTALIAILIFIQYIKPIDTDIKKNTEELDVLKLEYEEMEKIVSDLNIEPNYEEAKKNSQIKFEQNYPTYKIDEIVGAIFKQVGVERLTFGMEKEAKPMDSATYEVAIAQPRTLEEYQIMQTRLTSELMPLFLIRSATVTYRSTYEQHIQLLDAFNNVPPIGPGESDMFRYCFQIRELTLEDPRFDQNYVIDSLIDGSLTVSLYSMEPPSALDKPIIPSASTDNNSDQSQITDVAEQSVTSTDEAV